MKPSNPFKTSRYIYYLVNARYLDDEMVVNEIKNGLIVLSEKHKKPAYELTALLRSKMGEKLIDVQLTPLDNVMEIID